MVYKLRFIQSYDKCHEDAFWHWEHKFIELEKKTPELKVGKRYVPMMGKEPTNTLIWEAEYESLEEAVRALEILENNREHDELMEHQLPYMRDAYVELYRLEESLINSEKA
jgi:hypothetical protein